MLFPLGSTGKINPIVALNSAFIIMKPLLMDGRALNQCHSLDHSKGDFKKVSSKENKLALYEDIQLIRPDLYATTG
jgi:hypothetical protein